MNYNDYLRVINVIHYFHKYDIVDHFFVVDNCSKNGEFALLQKEFENDSDVSVIYSCQNGGYARGYNLGLNYIKQFNPDYCILINSDIFVPKVSINDCICLLQQNPNIAVSSCICKDPKNPKIQSFWNEPLFSETILGFMGFDKMVSYWDSKRSFESIGSNANKCFAVRGSLMVMNFRAVESVDFFDDDSFLYCEESKLGQKLLKKGYCEAIITNDFYIHNHIYGNDQKQKQYVYYSKSKYSYFKRYKKFGFVKKIIFFLCSSLGFILRIPIWLISSFKRKLKKR